MSSTTSTSQIDSAATDRVATGRAAATKRVPLNGFALYLMSLAFCIASYSLYAKFLVPIIEGPPNLVQRPIIAPEVDPPSARKHQAMLTQLLPEDAWEHGPCKTLLTESGTILFQNFEPVEGGFLEVFPFTLLVANKPQNGGAFMTTPSTTQVRPTILRCLRGARLKFDRPATEVFSGKAKLESARLVGQVDISRPATLPTSNDALQISTSNVQIDQQKIYTVDPVSFSLGPHRGQGKNLSIEFARDPSVNLITGDFSNIQGVKRMELAFLDWIRIAPQSENRGQSDFDSPPSESSGLNDPLAIRCAGPFVFELENGIATFSDNVIVQSESPTREQITCDQLTLNFEKGKPFEKTPNAAVANSKSPMAGMKLNQMVATGSPAVVFSPTRAAKITGDLLRYDLQTSQIVAQQTNPNSGPATIVSPQHQLVAPKFTYYLKAAASSENQQHDSLGPITALGPGKLLRISDETKPAFLVQWNEQLSVTSESDQTLVTLTGGCGVRIGNDTSIDAGKIQLWLKQTPTALAATDATGTNATSKSSYQPTKVIAAGDVEIDSPSLVGTTQQLTATWPTQNAEGVSTTPQRTRVSPCPPENTLTCASGLCFYQAPALPRHAVNRIAAAQISDETSPTRFQPIQRREPIRRDSQVAPTRFDQEISVGQKKYAFRANTVDVKLSLKNGQTEIRELVASGQVALAELPAASVRANPASPATTQIAGALPEDSPLTVEGESLTLVTQPEQRVRLLVRGTTETPASVKTQALRLSGTQLHLDQLANKLWVDGAGQIHLKNSPTSQPTATDQSSLSGSATDAPSTNYETVAVTWLGGMVFDGHKVYFEERVEMSAEGKNEDGHSQVTSASSAGLSLQLKKPFDFRNLNSKQKSPAIEMEEVILVDRIIDSRRVFPAPAFPAPKNAATDQIPPTSITHQTFSKTGELLEQQKFVTSQATFNAVTGKLNAAGPGVILHHARGKTPLIENGPAEKSQQNSANLAAVQNNENGNRLGDDSEDSAITFIRVNFDRSADADTKSKQMLLQGNVRTLYSTVQSFDQILDPDQTAPLPLDSVQVTCDQLKLAQWTQRNANQPTQELLATGNAHIIGTAFEATADRVSYNQSADMLVVEGTPRSNANLWFKQTPNARQRDHLVAGKILYRLSDQWTEIQSVKNIGINRR